MSDKVDYDDAIKHLSVQHIFIKLDYTRLTKTTVLLVDMLANEYKYLILIA
jgi:hypothetical protein